MDQEFDAGALSKFDGRGGNKAYVAYKGKVYDVTGSGFWEEGDHLAMHAAGQDLTGEIDAAPHGDEVMERFPQVGAFKTA